MITKSDVEIAFKRYRRASQSAGVTSIIQLEVGKRGQGTQHRVSYGHPNLEREVSVPIGRTYAEAACWLEGAATAMESYVVAAKFGGRTLDLPLVRNHGEPSPIRHDPDARTVTRKGQDHWHPELPV